MQRVRLVQDAGRPDSRKLIRGDFVQDVELLHMFRGRDFVQGDFGGATHR